MMTPPGHTEVPKGPGQAPHIDHSPPKKYTALDIGSQTIELDTTDFARIDYPTLFQTIRAAFPGFLPYPPARSLDKPLKNLYNTLIK